MLWACINVYRKKNITRSQLNSLLHINLLILHLQAQQLFVECQNAHMCAHINIMRTNGSVQVIYAIWLLHILAEFMDTNLNYY